MSHFEDEYERKMYEQEQFIKLGKQQQANATKKENFNHNKQLIYEYLSSLEHHRDAYNKLFFEKHRLSVADLPKMQYNSKAFTILYSFFMLEKKELSKKIKIIEDNKDFYDDMCDNLNEEVEEYEEKISSYERKMFIQKCMLITCFTIMFIAGCLVLYDNPKYIYMMFNLLKDIVYHMFYSIYFSLTKAKDYTFDSFWEQFNNNIYVKIVSVISYMFFMILVIKNRKQYHTL